MKKDFDFVYLTIMHTNNTLVHYPAIKKLISIFEKKWKLNKNDNTYKIYCTSLKLALDKTNLKLTI